MANENIKVICVTETMVDSSIQDGELKIANFDIYRKDRNLHGGGVAIYVHHSLKVFEISLNSLAEAVCLEFSSGRQNFLILCVYRPPNSSDGLLVPQLLREVASLHPGDNFSLFICGDFNFPNIDWTLMKQSGSNSSL